MKKINNKKGFTLVELIVVIVIIGILATVLVPNLVQYIDKAKCSKDIAELKQMNDEVTNQKYFLDTDSIDEYKAVEIVTSAGFALSSSVKNHAFVWNTSLQKFQYINTSLKTVLADGGTREFGHYFKDENQVAVDMGGMDEVSQLVYELRTATSGISEKVEALKAKTSYCGLGTTLVINGDGWIADNGVTSVTDIIYSFGLILIPANESTVTIIPSTVTLPQTVNAVLPGSFSTITNSFTISKDTVYLEGSLKEAVRESNGISFQQGVSKTNVVLGLDYSAENYAVVSVNKKADGTYEKVTERLLYFNSTYYFTYKSNSPKLTFTYDYTVGSQISYLTKDVDNYRSVTAVLISQDKEVLYYDSNAGYITYLYPSLDSGKYTFSVDSRIKDISNYTLTYIYNGGTETNVDYSSELGSFVTDDLSSCSDLTKLVFTLKYNGGIVSVMSFKSIN